MSSCDLIDDLLVSLTDDLLLSLIDDLLPSLIDDLLLSLIWRWYYVMSSLPLETLYEDQSTVFYGVNIFLRMMTLFVFTS